MSEKSCTQFMAAWDSKHKYCCTCKYWDVDELTCLNPTEVAKRKKAREIADLEKQMKTNKAVYLG